MKQVILVVFVAFFAATSAQFVIDPRIILRTQLETRIGTLNNFVNLVESSIPQSPCLSSILQTLSETLHLANNNFNSFDSLDTDTIEKTCIFVDSTLSSLSQTVQNCKDSIRNLCIQRLTEYKSELIDFIETLLSGPIKPCYLTLRVSIENAKFTVETYLASIPLNLLDFNQLIENFETLFLKVKSDYVACVNPKTTTSTTTQATAVNPGDEFRSYLQTRKEDMQNLLTAFNSNDAFGSCVDDLRNRINDVIYGIDIGLSDDLVLAALMKNSGDVENVFVSIKRDFDECIISVPITTEQPTTLELTEQPTTLELTEQPTTLPSSQEPTTLEPTEQPTTLELTEQPTTIPSSQEPTTLEPTEQPTTLEPTEQPTTLELTEQPTTLELTEQPTTLPSSQEPTTLEPIETTLPPTESTTSTISSTSTLKAPIDIPSSGNAYTFVPLNGATRIEILVKASKNAYIAFSNIENDFVPPVEIVIGTATNTKTQINQNMQKVAEVATPEILSGTEFRKFIVEFKNEMVSLFQGDATTPLISYQVLKPFDINFIAVRSQFTPSLWNVQVL